MSKEVKEKKSKKVEELTTKKRFKKVIKLAGVSEETKETLKEFMGKVLKKNPDTSSIDNALDSIINIKDAKSEREVLNANFRTLISQFKELKPKKLQGLEKEFLELFNGIIKAKNKDIRFGDYKFVLSDPVKNELYSATVEDDDLVAELKQLESKSDKKDKSEDSEESDDSDDEEDDDDSDDEEDDEE